MFGTKYGNISNSALKVRVLVTFKLWYECGALSFWKSVSADLRQTVFSVQLGEYVRENIKFVSADMALYCTLIRSPGCSLYKNTG